MEKELMLQCFIIWLKIKKNIAQILFLEHLIWFNYLDHSPCVPGSIIDVYLAFRVSPPLRVLGLSFSVLGLGPMYNKRPGSRSRVPPLSSRVSGPGSHPWDGSRFSGLGSHQQPRVSGPTIRICLLRCSFMAKFFSENQSHSKFSIAL